MTIINCPFTFCVHNNLEHKYECDQKEIELDRIGVRIDSTNLALDDEYLICKSFEDRRVPKK